jgi:hypothetical protein
MSDLDELPRMQFHRFSPWDVDPKVCAFCGQLPQAHPAAQRPADQEDGGS